MKKVHEILKSDPDLGKELISRLKSGEKLGKALGMNTKDNPILAMITDKLAGPVKMTNNNILAMIRNPLVESPEMEAMILPFLRPVLMIQKNRIIQPDADELRKRMAPYMARLESRVPSVGRIEFKKQGRIPYGGTGWLVSEDTILTNRHVALLVAEKKGRVISFRKNLIGDTMEAYIDFGEEYTGPNKPTPQFEVQVEKIMFMTEDKSTLPDIALLKLKKHNKLPAPIPLSDEPLVKGQMISVIGYPAFDSRGILSIDAAKRVFGGIYDVKRCSPGEVTVYDNSSWYFNHDCSTLGGNSGSPIIDLKSGNAVGLHCMGDVGVENYAVKAGEVIKYLRQQKVVIPVSKPLPSVVPMKALEEAPPENYDDREGFQEDFLGKKAIVTLPEVKKDAKDILTFKEKGKKASVLKYHHFSVVMNKKRRMCFFSAVNIDGALSKKGVKRTAWKYDSRIPKSIQIKEECYGNPPQFSRGHMTRKEDPIWGSLELARAASADTFHYTNATPQMQPFNAPVWLKLEDYALDHAQQDKMKISVITGPVLADGDPEKYGVAVPLEFFKIIAFIHDDTKKLCATGYTISQETYFRQDEFVYGMLDTWQVPISVIEQKTGLDFGTLRNADPLKGKTLETAGFGPLNNIEEVVFTK